VDTSYENQPMSILTICFMLCSVVGFMNVYRLWKDKRVCGVSYVPQCIYAATNAIEVFYFGVRGDWWTSAGAALMFTGTGSWLALSFWFAHVEKRRAYIERCGWLEPIDSFA
jgi:hypothetical protein